jgi:preprotein translocase subunit SecD
MNRYPWWKYAILVHRAADRGLLYTLPNFFGEAPAVQVSSGKATSRSTPRWSARRAGAAGGRLKPDFVQFDGNSVKARFGDTDTRSRPRTRSPRR